MNRPRAAALLAISTLALAGIGCGSDGQTVDTRGADLFAERCGGCHTLEAAGTEGSSGERPTGPNLNQRKETRDQVLYAIRNGGFSGAIMPQNIVVGPDAQAVAEFVSRNAGKKAKNPPSPKSQTGTTGATGQSGEE